jgi:hypothetical protein
MPVLTKNNGDFTIKIYQDDTPESPREWDNLGIMVCFHKQYILGDQKHGFQTPDDLAKKIKENGIIALPIYMMDHSGLTISTSTQIFSQIDPQKWDWGQLGYIFVTQNSIRENFQVKNITKDIKEKVIEILNQEIETYNQYLNGEVLGFVIEDSEGNHLESCCGFYGVDICLQEANSLVKHIANNLVGSGAGI